VDLSLSHNLLTGTIPLHARHIETLDVSNNKLTGEFDDTITYTNTSTVQLEINRISGRLPKTQLNKAKTVKVLHGNMFDCDTVPHDDNVHDHDYVCESSMFDLSLLLWGFVIAALLLSASPRFKARFHALSPTLHIRALKQHLYLTFFDTFSNKRFLKQPQFQVIATFTRYLNETGSLFLILSGLLIFISLPLCFMKMFEGTDFSKYSHDYLWVWCLTHLHGTAPAVLIILAWAVVVGFCVFWFPRHYDVSPRHASKYVMTRENFSIVFSLFILNAVVVSSANALYIATLHMHITRSVQFMIRLLMAAFKYATNVIFTPLLCLPIKDPSKNIMLRLRIFVFNNVLIPCMVTFFTSRSCFQVYARLLQQMLLFRYHMCLVYHHPVLSSCPASSHHIAGPAGGGGHRILFLLLPVLLALHLHRHGPQLRGVLHHAGRGGAHGTPLLLQIRGDPLCSRVHCAMPHEELCIISIIV
jgi:hypothetical protein